MNDDAISALRILRSEGERPQAQGRPRLLTRAWRYACSAILRRRDARSTERLKRTLGAHGVRGVVLDVPWFRGMFEMNPDSSLALSVMRGRFENDAPALMDRLVLPGTDAIDIGANIGLFSVCLASLVGSNGRVLAVEPSAVILPMLRSNLERNNARNVIVHEGLLAEEAGEREFHSVDRSPEYSSIGAIVHPHAPREVSTLTVGATTLDILVDRHGLRPSFVKIDVEGAEGLVVTGARETFQRFRPAILSEVDDRLLRTLGYTSPRVFRAFEELNYRVFDLADGMECVSSKGGIFIGGVLALPQECCELA